MHRFFIPPENILESQVIFPDYVAYQLAKVLRINKGEECIVFDGTNIEYLVRLDEINSIKALGSIVKIIECSREANIKVSLFQALIKPDRFEYAIQKSVEIGVHKIIPIISDRTEYNTPSESRIKRWNNIIRESAEQSGRTTIPSLDLTINLDKALKSAPKVSLILWEMEKIKSIKGTLKEIKNNLPKEDLEIAIFTGPVGGFVSTEIELAIRNDVIPVSLGARILRSETAGLVAATTILYEFGDLEY